MFVFWKKENGNALFWEGRIARLPYFIIGSLCSIMIAISAGMVGYGVFLMTTEFISQPTPILILGTMGTFCVVLLGTIWAAYMLTVKRLHDIEMSGWFVFVHIFSAAGLIWSIWNILTCGCELCWIIVYFLMLISCTFKVFVIFLPGTKGANMYGLPPV